MPVTDLATLAQTKSWLTNAPASADDALLGALITSASGSILSYLQRQPPGIVQAFTDTFDGYGECKKMLRRWPVLSVSSLTIDNTSVTLSAAMVQVDGCGEAWLMSLMRISLRPLLPT